jgi:hypothetical protein
MRDPGDHLRARLQTILGALPFTAAFVILILIAEWAGCDWTK